MTQPAQPLAAPAWFAKYRKAVGQVAVTVLLFVATVLTGGVDAHEWVLIAGVTISALNTALVPELDAGIGAIAKSASTFLLAGLTVVATAALGHMGATEWIEAVVAALAAVGVTALPNDWPPASRPALPSSPVRPVP